MGLSRAIVNLTIAYLLINQMLFWGGVTNYYPKPVQWILGLAIFAIMNWSDQ